MRLFLLFDDGLEKKHYFCDKFYPMKKVYEVAGHKFGVVMPDNDVVWSEMEPYKPFETEDSGDCIFTAEMIESMPDVSDKERVTVSCQGSDMPRIELYEWKGKWLMAMAPVMDAPVRGYFITDKSFKNAKFRLLGSVRFTLNTVMMLMYKFATARKNTLLMHASVTMKDGKGYMFLGKSGTGKSTHSQLWIDNIEGCSLLNDDNPVLKVGEDGEVRVYGSPWSGKTPCYRNLNVPVGAIVSLNQAKVNKIRRQTLPEAYASVYVSFSGYRFMKKMADGLHITNAQVVGSVPCYQLDCLPNAEAAFLCYNTVAK